MRRTTLLGCALAAVLVAGARGEDTRTVLAETLRGVALSMAADGSRLAVLDRGGSVHLLDPADGTESAVVPGSKEWKGVGFAGADASTLVTSGSDVCIWSVAKAKAVRNITPAPMPAKDKEGASKAAPENGFAAAASPRDKLVAVAGADRRIVLWSTATDRDAGSIPSGGVGIAAAFSPDGTKLAAVLHRPGGGRRVEVYDVTRRSLAWRIEITDFDAMQKDPGTPLIGWSGAEFSADGKTLVVKCGDPRFTDGEGRPLARGCAVRAYGLEKKKELWTRRFEDQFVWRAVVSPADGRVAVATAAGVVMLNPATGERSVTLEAPGGEVRDLEFSPDGTRLFGVGAAPGVIRWELGGADKAAQVETPPPLATAAVKFRGNVRSIAISPDGATLAAVEGEGTSYDSPTRVRTYDLAKGTFRRETDTEKRLGRDVAFIGPDSDLIAYSDGQGRICVWSSAMGTRSALIEERTLRGPLGVESCPIACHAASQCTRELAVACRGKDSAPIVAVVDPVDSRVRSRPSTDGAVGRPIAMAFSDDGLRLCAVFADAAVALVVWRRPDPKSPWDAGRVLRTDFLGGANTLWWHELAFTHDGRYVVARTDITGMVAERAVVVVWQPEAGGEPWVGVTGAKNGGLGLAVSPRGDGVALSAFQGATLFDPATCATIRKLPGTRHLPDGLAFSPDGRRLYAALDQELVGWDLGAK